MGRITHSKRTQNPHLPSELKIKTSNTILNSLSELSQVRDQFQDLPQYIGHIDIQYNSESISKIYNALSEFSKLSQKITNWYDENEIIIKNQDQLTNDMLHEIELSRPKDLYRAYKCYKTLKESRQLRRKAKTENKMLSPLYNYIKLNPTLPNDLRSINEKCAGIQYDMSHAQYSFKSDLKID